MYKHLMNLLLQFLKFLISLLESKPIEKKEDIKQVNQEVFKEIKDTPSLLGLPKVEVDSKIESLVKEPVSQPTTNLKIIQHLLPPSQYMNENTEKNCIFIHHTVSPSNSVEGDINWWLNTSERVGCHFLIDRFGNIYQTVPLEKWIHHLAVSFKRNNVPVKYKSQQWNIFLNKHSIGIELDSAGGLSSKNGMWKSSYNKFIPFEDVYELPSSFRGFKAFEKYHSKQLESLETLLLWLLDKYPNIKESLKDKKDYSNIFDIDENALKGVPGLYGHVSVRRDKSDPFPDKNLINLLNNLYIKL